MSRVGLRDVVSCLFRFVRMTILHNTVKGAFLNPVIYVDKRIIVLNKSPGLVCQLNSPQSESVDNNFNSLLKAIRNRFQLDSDPYPVHRLDKGTTGSLVLARTLAMARELSLQFQQRTVEKTYLALVRGGNTSFTSTRGQIRTPIQYTDGRASLDLSGLGTPSVTDWDLVGSSQFAPFSLLRLKLHTGHKHQLRVHLAHYLRTPILGDTLYSSSPINEAIAKITPIPRDRIYLHASEISFLRYKPSGKRIRLSVHAPLPSDFFKLCRDFKDWLHPLEVDGGISIDGTIVKNGEIPDLKGYWGYNDAVPKSRVKYNYNKRRQP